MSECNSMLLSLTNKLTFAFTHPQTNSSVETSDNEICNEIYKVVNFGNNGSDELYIWNCSYGSKYVYSYSNREGYKITVDNQGTNHLTGAKQDGYTGHVDLKMIEIYEIECKVPPKQPKIPSIRELEIHEKKKKEEI